MVSLLPTPAPLSPVETPTSSPAMPTFTPTATSTATPTRFPTTTPFPTLEPGFLLADSLQYMAVREAVASGAEYTLYQMSRTRLGVAAVEWSPDGEHLWLAMAAGPGGYGDRVPAAGIVMSLDGSRVWLASGVEDPADHDWSPDGQHLVFMRDGTLWVADAGGQAQHSVLLATEMWLSPPHFAPNGDSIALVVTGSDNPYSHETLLIDPFKGEAQVIQQGALAGIPIWSPQGDALAIQDLGQLDLIALSTGKIVRFHLTDVPGSDACCPPPPTWVLDGNQVLATALLSPGVWLLDRAGVVERLDTPPGETTGRRPPGLAAPLLGGPRGYAVASADGRYVAYSNGGPLSVRELVSSHEFATTCVDVVWSPAAPRFVCLGEPLRLVDARTGAEQLLAGEGTQPAWSPDGQRIVFWRHTPVVDTLWMADVSGEISVRLLLSRVKPEAQYPGWPYYYNMTVQWSPRGDALAFIARWEGMPEVYLLELDLR